MANHPSRRKGYRKLYFLEWRSSRTGTCISEEYETRRERDDRLAALKSAADVEWVAVRGNDPISSSSRYGK